jgi:ribonuclease D
MIQTQEPACRVLDHDVSTDLFDRVRDSIQFDAATPVLAIDIETTLCNFEEPGYWRRGEIGVVTVHYNGLTEVVRRPGPESSPWLTALLSDRRVVKLFHHALFDGRFLSHHLGVRLRNMECTKVAAKIGWALYPERFPERMGLKSLLEYFSLIQPGEMNKEVAVSDWLGALTAEQLAYCEGDVKHLYNLLRVIRREAGPGAQNIIGDAFHKLELVIAQQVYNRAQDPMTLIRALPDFYRRELLSHGARNELTPDSIFGY